MSEAAPEKRGINRKRVERAVREILVGIGEDPDREGLLGTPERVADAYAYLFAGLGEDPTRHLEVGFMESARDTVLVRDIPLASLCEHHILPFVGKAHLGYAPQGRVVGLSKLARLVEGYARRPQLQEQLTAQIADALYGNLGSRGSIVVIEAEHLCYDRETEILTRRGWVRFDDFGVEDEVAQVDPCSLEMTFVRPLSYVRYRYSGSMLKWRSDMVSLLVTPEHRMVYRTDGDLRRGPDRPWSVAPAYSMPPSFYVPQAVEWTAPDLDRIHFAGREMSGDAFAAFLGIWLAEGCTRAHGKDVVVSQNTGEKETDTWSLLAGLPFGFKRVLQPDHTHVHFRSSDRALYQALRAFGKSRDKRVPDVIKRMSSRQIELFLHWFAVGEGHVYKHDPLRVRFVSTSQRLIDDVQELLLRIGETGARQTYKNCSRIEVRTHKREPEEWNKRWGYLRACHREEVDFDDEVFCVSVPTGAVLVRREGRPIVSGNCMTMRGVQKPGSITVTSAVRGVYEQDAALRSEAMAMISRATR